MSSADLLIDWVGGTTCADFLEHGVGNDDFRYPSVEQVKLPDFGRQDQGRGIDDSPDRRCHYE
jgi:hypothetical protein